MISAMEDKRYRAEKEVAKIEERLNAMKQVAKKGKKWVDMKED